MLDSILNFINTTGIAQLIAEEPVEIVKTLVMYVIIGALFYLAIVKKFEPLLLLPIAFGMLLANLPGANLIHIEFFFDDHYLTVVNDQVVGTLGTRFNEFLAWLPDTLHGVSEVVAFPPYKNWPMKCQNGVKVSQYAGAGKIKTKLLIIEVLIQKKIKIIGTNVTSIGLNDSIITSF